MIEYLIAWLTIHNSVLQVTGNIVISTVLYILSGIILYHLARKTYSVGLTSIIIGVFLEAFGWALNRTYWAASWMFEIVGGMADFAPNGVYGWISLIPFLIIIPGLILIITPVTISAYSKHTFRPYIYMSAAIVTYTLIVYHLLHDFGLK